MHTLEGMVYRWCGEYVHYVCTDTAGGMLHMEMAHVVVVDGVDTHSHHVHVSLLLTHHVPGVYAMHTIYLQGGWWWCSAYTWYVVLLAGTSGLAGKHATTHAPGTGAADQVHSRYWWYPPADPT